MLPMCVCYVWCVRVVFMGFRMSVFAGGLYMYVKHTCVHAPVHAWERGI